jgi:hypothetical protein
MLSLSITQSAVHSAPKQILVKGENRWQHLRCRGIRNKADRRAAGLNLKSLEGI